MVRITSKETFDLKRIRVIFNVFFIKYCVSLIFTVSTNEKIQRWDREPPWIEMDASSTYWEITIFSFGYRPNKHKQIL